MTPDERINALIERHEALAETVELNSHQIELSRQIRDLIVAISKDAEKIRALARIADAHEHRI